MDPAVFPLVLLTCLTLFTVLETQSITALYGETIVIPCNGGNPPPEDLVFIKWIYKRDDGTTGDLLIKQIDSEQATVQAIDEYARRVSISDTFSLLISQASLKDQKVFTCMLVSVSANQEYSSNVIVQKAPSSVQIFDTSEALQKDKLTIVGTCVVADSNPAADISWKKSGNLLVSDGKAVVISSSFKLNPATGLSTTTSTLQYAAAKEDSDAVFTCISTYNRTNKDVDLKPFPIYYPSEKASLQILSKEPIVEGSNVTLKCHGDGSPPPSSFFFYKKGVKELVENSNTYILTSIGRDAAGEYKCSLADDEKIMASKHIVVNYIDLTVSLTGRTVKKLGDVLPVKTEMNTSGNATVTWIKNGVKVKEPQFNSLTYADAGVYICKVSMSGLTEQRRFELVVEGKPWIINLRKHIMDRSQVLICEANAVPEPRFEWSIGSKTEDSFNYTDGKAVSKITVVPEGNLTVSCTVTNSYGEDVKTIDLYPEPSGNSSDHIKLIAVGLVVGLVSLAAVAGLAFCLRRKSRRQGSWSTRERNTGTPEENETLQHHNI
ncbi:CD166 antigen homolog [Austrofundulus limnaeus]|uniref:CD166 antigen homolog n=1 Tax=Austrofundulus limnaeus TaxID=52670 RepID=A0A2I4D369_AUSLI|nr:PREDICTED: CD166 antigen homolog [Austrofundulus limnaeus]